MLNDKIWRARLLAGDDLFTMQMLIVGDTALQSRHSLSNNYITLISAENLLTVV